MSDETELAREEVEKIAAADPHVSNTEAYRQRKTLARRLLATMDELAEARATLAAEWGEAEGAASEGWRPHYNDHGFQCWALWQARKVIAQAHRERGLWWLTGWVPAVEALADQPFHHAREAMRAADAALTAMEPPDAD